MSQAIVNGAHADVARGATTWLRLRWEALDKHYYMKSVLWANVNSALRHMTVQSAPFYALSTSRLRDDLEKLTDVYNVSTCANDPWRGSGNAASTCRRWRWPIPCSRCSCDSPASSSSDRMSALRFLLHYRNTDSISLPDAARRPTNDRPWPAASRWCPGCTPEAPSYGSRGLGPVRGCSRARLWSTRAGK